MAKKLDPKEIVEDENKNGVRSQHLTNRGEKGDVLK